MASVYNLLNDTPHFVANCSATLKVDSGIENIMSIIIILSFHAAGTGSVGWDL
jgi:hypothetical protein